ncbi:hypothetical protein [Cypionkella sp.]|jgi:hypothetical protein|nr:hypothetical protein [Cypionkella sp.]MDO8982619.1 hypothetical protein [Cypionkella sp.]MDP1575328.1 hypothetical protein [Cypionkella sp.]MDP2049937.1 hypothetical protein [Cypionkella sp.]
MKRLPLIALLVLTACGADGPPTAPKTGITLSGDARVGISSGETP